MNLIRKQFVLFATVLLVMLPGVFSQPSIEMNFQGILTDAAGQKIRNEPFQFTVKLMTPEPGRAELLNQACSSQSDEEGWFSFSMPEISKYLMVDGQITETLVIRLEFLPNEKTKWIRQGEDFMVSYTLTPTLRDNSIYLKMSRMEGSELAVHLEDHLYAFKDEYPFAYLTGGFLLTDAPPLTQNSVDDLRQWIAPDPTEDGAATRSVKGGFPQGGYRKR